MQPTVLADYHNAVQFAAERFSPVAVAQTERMKIILTCFEPGQFIPVHAPRVDMALVVLEGDAVVVAGSEEEHRVGPGAIVVVPAGQMRGVRAATRLVALHMVSPPPGEADHAEVQAGLHQGTWR
jgi:quercetin dioxygenase-like cupin family protein